MKKPALALSMIIIAVATLVIVAWFVQYQFIQHQLTVLQNENSSLQAQNNDLQDKNRNLRFETKDSESQNDELVKQLGDLTKQLALERALRVEIVKLSHEDHWTDYGPYLGVQRARNVFNVTVRNNDVATMSGLRLTVEMFSGGRSVGGVFSWKIDLLRVGEEREITGETIVPNDFLSDLTFIATLRSGDVVLDELKLPLTAARK